MTADQYGKIFSFKNLALQTMQHLCVFAHQKILQRVLTAASYQRLWVLQADESASVKNAFDENKAFLDEIEMQKISTFLFYVRLRSAICNPTDKISLKYIKFAVSDIF